MIQIRIRFNFGPAQNGKRLHKGEAMKKILAVLTVTLGTMAGMARAGTFYDSPVQSTGSGLANMGLAGTFNFYASSRNHSAPPLVIGTTNGIYAPTFLGIEMATGTFRNWVKSSSITSSGQIAAATFKGDGSGLFNLSTGGIVDAAAVAAATTTLYTQLSSTGVSLSRLWSSSLSTWTALVSTGVTMSNFITSTNSTMTVVRASTSSIYINLTSTGISLSRLWTSAFSTYTALVGTGTALTAFQNSANSTMTALSASTTTLRMATSTLQGITTALTVSTTTLGTSTATLKSRLDEFIVKSATVQTRIDQLQVFASTGQQVIRALSNSTATIRTSISSGVVGLYDSGGTFLANVTTIRLGNNLIATVNGIAGATATIVAVTTTPTNSGIFRIYTIVDSDTSTQVQVSTINLQTNEFTREVGGVDSGSQTWRISNATHVFTAIQTFSSATATSLTVFGDLKGGSNATFPGTVSGSQLTTINLSTYPIVNLIDGNQNWQVTTRNLDGGTFNRMFVIADASGGLERFQIEKSSGLVAVGGDIVGGLNSNTFPPGSAKFTVHGGSLAVTGGGARIFVQGLIQSASGFIFPDGSTQTIAANLTNFLTSTNTWTGKNIFTSGVTVSSTIQITSNNDNGQFSLTRGNVVLRFYETSTDINLDFNGATNGTTFRADSSPAIFLGSNLAGTAGNVQIGDTSGATQRLRVDHGNIEAVDGGLQASTWTISGVTVDPSAPNSTQGRLAYRRDSGDLRFNAGGAGWTTIGGSSATPIFQTVNVSSVILKGLSAATFPPSNPNAMFFYNSNIGKIQFSEGGSGWVSFSSFVILSPGVITSTMTTGLLKTTTDFFTGILQLTGSANQQLVIDNNVGGQSAEMMFKTGGQERGRLGFDATDSIYEIYNASSSGNGFRIRNANGNPLFMKDFSYITFASSRASGGADNNNFVFAGASVGVNMGQATTPSSMVDVVNGSITVRGNGAGIMVTGGTVTTPGIIVSTVSINKGGSIVFGDNTIQTTAASGTGGGGTSKQSIFDVVIGTPGTPGVDYNGTSIATMTNQAYSDRGVSIGAVNGVSTNTLSLNIGFRKGIYGGNNSTCPANVYWYTVPNPSGTIFSMENDSWTLVTNYGNIDGFVLDGGSRPFTAAMVRMMDNSKFKNFTIIGVQGMANFTAGGSVFSAVKSSEVIISDGWFKEYHGCAGKVYQGQCSDIRIEDSTNTYTYRVRFSTPAFYTSPYETVWSNVRSKGSFLYDCTFEGITSIAVSIGSGRDTKIKGNIFQLGAGSQGDGPNYGTITIDGSDEPIATGASTMTVISDNFFTFISTGGAPGRIIRSRSYGGGIANGIKVLNNQVSSPIRTNWIFYHQNGGTVFNTVLEGNMVDNLETFYSATSGGGAGDQYQSLGNMLNAREQ